MRKILVIEDEMNIRETLMDILQAHSFEVITAINGVDGLEKAVKENPDLIISDIMMPEKTGLDVLEELNRMYDRKSYTPFIFLTAKSDHDDIRKGMAMGADDYLLKPFRIDDLIATIDRVLSKREALLTEAQTRERQRISTFLHDGVQQLLVLGHLNIARAKLNASLLDDKTSELLVRSSELLETAIDEIRTLSHIMVAKRTLEASARDMIGKITSNCQLEVCLTYQCDTDIDFEIKYQVMNILHEAFNNILKHAEASEASLSIMESGSDLEIEIKDNGKGFEIGSFGFGLTKIQEYVSKVKGAFHIESELERGTFIFIRLPIKYLE